MIDLRPSRIDPTKPRVDGIEELIRIKRQNQLDQAKFEREIARLRTGLISVKSLRNKEIFINILLSITFIILIIIVFRLINSNQYHLAIITLFILIIYSITIFGLHDNNIKKIALSMKNIRVEK